MYIFTSLDASSYIMFVCKTFITNLFPWQNYDLISSNQMVIFNKTLSLRQLYSKSCMTCDTKYELIEFFSYLYLGISFSVQHCSPMIPRVRCANVTWSELTARSLSSTAPGPQVKCSNGVSSDRNNLWALPGIEPGTLRNRVKDLNHCATLLLIIKWNLAQKMHL